MATEPAVDSFFDLLRQSELVSEDQLRALMAEAGGECAEPDDARKLADELIKREILTAWQAGMLLQGKHRGFRLGPYRILRPLGHGGMSKVFLAQHEVMRRCCAIKVLPSKYEDDPDLLSRFRLEARAVAALDHPNIVRAYDFNKDVRYGKQIHYLVMEYVEGPDLRRMVDEGGPLDYRKAADYICQAAEGLAHAHAAGFVHRDIKPANLLVDPHGVLKVLDLGLARFDVELEQSESPPEGGQSAVGTADYIAPEQVADSANVDGRADIYSLGCTFYFLLTGRRPFTKPTVVELLMAHRTEHPEPIGKTRPDVPMDLEAIIDTMIAKSPFQRYQTAKEVAEKLRTWLRESGSGRGYSRISALMAEALRAKQLAGQDTARMRSSSTEDTELELASLEDEEKDKEPAANRAASESAHKRAAPEGAPAADKKDETVLPTVNADLLSVPLAEALVTAAPAAEPLPAPATGEGPLPAVARPKPKVKAAEESILRSPWPWVGAAGVLLIASLSLLLIPFGRQSTKEASDAGAVAQVLPPTPVAEKLPPPPPPSPPASEQVSPPPPPAPELPAPSKTVEPLDTATAPPDKAPLSPEAEKVEPQPVPEKKMGRPRAIVPDGATLSKPPEIVAPSTPERGGGKEQETAKVATTVKGADEKLEPQKPLPEPPPNPEELLGNMTVISLGSVNFKSFDSGPKKALTEMASIHAWRVASQLELTAGQKDKEAAVMDIEFSLSADPDFQGWVITAELKCPTKSGKAVSVWKSTGLVLEGDPKKLRWSAASRQIIVQNLTKFFAQFREAVRQARLKPEPEF